MKRFLKFLGIFFKNKAKEIWWVLSYKSSDTGWHWSILPIIVIFIVFAIISNIIALIVLPIVVFEGFNKLRSLDCGNYFYWNTITVYSLIALGAVSVFCYWIWQNIKKAWKESEK